MGAGSPEREFMHLPICEKLLALKEEGRIPYHMPGHKRKGPCDITSIDITEISGYDNLHHPEGMILDSMNQVREIYHSRASRYLINGSTVGLLASISAICHPGDEILIARNCHKAVYNAIRLLHLKPYYIYPAYCEEYDMMQGVTDENFPEIEHILRDHQGIRAVVITSPTYEGIVSDIRGISRIVHRYGIPLIVDEAHGAHFILHDYFPDSAVNCGADLVIQSTHKTLPALTQTALLHVCSDLVSAQQIDEMLGIYETSSPSYLLLASTEYSIIYPQNHADKVEEYVDKLADFRRKCAQLTSIRLLEPGMVEGYDYDRGKFVFLVRKDGRNGKDLFDLLLNRYHIECEMESGRYCIAMTSLMDSAEDMQALYQAIMEIDREWSGHSVNTDRRAESQEKSTEESGEKGSVKSSEERVVGSPKETLESDQEKVRSGLPSPGPLFSQIPERVCWVWQAYAGDKEKIAFTESVGRIAASYIYLYPPGIPVLVPGEKITKEIVANMNYYLYNGYNVPELSDGYVTVLR